MPNMVIQQNIKNKFNNNLLTKFISNRNNSKKKFNNYIKFYRNLRIIGSTSLVLLLLISFLTIHPLVYKENHVLATAGTAIASDTILTLSEYSSSAGLELLVRDTSGTFARSGEGNHAKFTVSTNNFTGYTLSISSNSNDGTLINKTIDTNTGIETVIDTLDSIENVLKEDAFSSASIYNNRWGYLPSKYNSLPNNSFLPSPTKTATTLDKTTTANTDTNGNTGATTNINDLVANEYTIGLGARVDYTKPAGTYANTFILSAIANPTNYTITYKDNSGDETVSNIPPVSSSSTSETSIILSDTIPTRTGYTFSGWCLGTVSSNGTVCNSTETLPGTIYPASTASKPSYFGIDQTTTNNTTLYAVWTISNYDLTINITTAGIKELKVCKVAGDCSDSSESDSGSNSNNSEGNSSLVATITSNGSPIVTTINNLPYTSTYYLYPTFLNNTTDSDSGSNSSDPSYLDFSLSYWAVANTNVGILSCIANGTCNTDTNPTFTIGAGTGEIILAADSTTMVAIQDITTSTCTTTPKKVYDKRDSEVYYIQKLADGNCWMLDNLNLDLTDATVVSSLNSTNTNATDTILGYLRNKDGGRANGAQYPTSGLTLTNWTSGDSYSAPMVKISGNCSTGTNGCTYTGSFVYSDILSTLTPDQSTFGLGQGKIGIFYNYCAASAGSYCYGDGASAGTNATGDAEYDICPANWRMPTGGDSGEYQALCTAINGSDCSYGQAMEPTSPDSLQYQLSTTLSGSYYGGRIVNYQGSNIDIWSSSIIDAAYDYILIATGVSVRNTQGARYRGRVVRCLLKTTDISQVSTMQDFATLPEADKTAVVDSMTTSTPYLLKDTRDNQTYTVAKLADGKVWMLDNLNLDLTDSAVVNKLSQYNTNATSTALNYLKNGGGADENQWANEGLALTNWATGNSYTEPQVNISGSCSKAGDYPCSYDGTYNHNQTLAEITGDGNTMFGLGQGKIGAYYNYCAISAGSYCYGGNNGNVDGATQDICPASWRIPIGGTNGEYQTLCTSIAKSECAEPQNMIATNVDSIQYQLSAPLSGNYGSTDAKWLGMRGDFWTATYANTTNMYNLRFSASQVWAQRYNHNRGSGMPVRCLLD